MPRYHRGVGRARRHQRLFSLLALGLLALVAELVGRGLVHRIDVGRHVASPVPPSADYYPVLLAALKLAVALLLARLAWRIVRARAAEVAARRVLAAVGARPRADVPRLRLRLSPRLWLFFFCATSIVYLVQTNAEQAASGRWPLLFPWLHTSALPVFAVLAVVLAVVWSAVQGWLADYERFAAETAEQARRLIRGACEPRSARPPVLADPPRRLFGLAFESRPPPLPASSRG